MTPMEGASAIEGSAASDSFALSKEHDIDWESLGW